jgi:hypothetical protein
LLAETPAAARARGGGLDRRRCVARREPKQ